MNETAILLRISEFAMLVLVVEAIVLLATGRSPRARHRLPARSIVLIAAAGLGLLLALRTALADGPAALVLAGLTLGGLAHAADLILRLRAAGKP